jgi:hypothetical protein
MKVQVLYKKKEFQKRQIKLNSIKKIKGCLKFKGNKKHLELLLKAIKNKIAKTISQFKKEIK